MDIRCDQCGSEYFLNDSQIPPDGIRVKCETCQNIFFVSPYGEDEPADEGEDEDAEPAKEFMIRRRKGSLLRFTELETLHEWILDGTVGPHDEIGTNDENWAELSMVPELKEVFARVRKKSSATKPSVRRATAPMGAVQEPTAPQHREPSRISSGPARDLVRHTEGEREPELGDKSFRELDRDSRDRRAQADRSRRSDARWDRKEPMEREPVVTREVPADDFEPVRRGARWPWVVGVVVLVAGVGLGGLFALGVLPSPFPGKSRGNLPPDPPAVTEEDQKLAEARKQMDVGTAAGYAAAVTALVGCEARSCQELRAISLALWSYVLSEDLEMFISKLPEELSDADRLARSKPIHNQVRQKAQESMAAARAMSEETATQQAALGLSQLLLDDAGANVAIEKAGLKDPQNPYYHFAKALFFQHGGDLIKAADLFEKIARTATPDNQLIIFHYAHGRAAIRMRDFARAGRALDHVCNRRPDHLVACQLAAEMVTRTANAPTDPVVPVEPGMDAPPTDPAGVPTPGMTTPDPGVPADPGKPDDDRGDFDYDTYFSKAEQYYRSGDKSRAKQYYLKAGQKDPTSVDAFSGAAYCDLDLGNASAAIPNFRKALALVPNFSKAQYGLAEALHQTGQKNEALNAYKRFLQLNPAGSSYIPRARMMVARLEQELGISSPEPEMTEPEMNEPAMDPPPADPPPMNEPAMDPPPADPPADE